MTMAEIMNLSGFDALEKNMKNFPVRVERNILGGMVRAGAVVIQKEARNLAPISHAVHLLKSYSSKLFKRYKAAKYGTWITPGNLRKSIKVTKLRTSATPNSVTYHIKASGKLSYYWLFIEFGTSKMAAKSFLRPAFESKKIEAIQRMGDYGAVRIEKEAAKR